ncbi:2'-5' RNA ligase family protein [Nocardiopsis changdeensis]|uniref:2'-5' RNA ligase family protein n=1 Tax=Nocardiopsis changdeensis TaxID=2831969 RepID=A0A975KUX7_9ACTN|nr:MULTISPECIES: 2'-5' RNA ligase family protein [Nocardiopsis]QUX26481.1 2'-5' RNA ligase family protein [Nocardiopsis changdeensis]QYX40753.1 2'-5' RNA ligase family protein [Nocardiopsis sp. MT53]
MTLTAPAPSTDATTRDHWWVRPGWGPTTSWWTVHATFGGQPGTPVLRAETARLRPLVDRTGWDLIPDRWLHLTMQGVGDTAQVDAQRITAVAAAVRRAVAGTGPLVVELGPVAVDAEGINLPARGEGARALDAVRDRVREAIGEVVGADGVEGGPEWRPHVSLAYANTTGLPLEPVREDLAAAGVPVMVEVDHLSLIALRRDGHLYRWDRAEALPLA